MSRQNSMDVASLEVTVNGSQVSVDPIGNGTKPFDDVKVMLVKGIDGTGAESLAPEFSPSEQYWENQSFCTHDGKLYLCTTRHLAQPWNPADFTEVTVSDAFMAKGRDRVTAGRLAGSTAGNASTAEGQFNTASGTDSHAEGYRTKATKTSSHSEGSYTEANHNDSHAEGNHTVTGCNNQHVQGKYNVGKANTAFEIGNGTSDNARSNALEVDWNGDTKLSGSLRVWGENSVIYSTTLSANSSITIDNGRINTNVVTINVSGTVVYEGTTSASKPLYYYDGNSTTCVPYRGFSAITYPSETTITIYKVSKVADIEASGSVIDGMGNSLSQKLNKAAIAQFIKKIVVTNWSATQTSGYYTYTLSLLTNLMMNPIPNISGSGANITTPPTEAQMKAYDCIVQPNGYVEHYSSDTLKLYAKEKPESDFYIMVEGIYA